MTYQSPFDALYCGYEGRAGLSRLTYAILFNTLDPNLRLSYYGGLDETLSELATLPDFPETPADRWALHPPRVLRAIINYKIAYHQNSPAEALLQDALPLCLGIYRDPKQAPAAVAQLRGKIAEYGLEEILAEKIHQTEDIATMKASHPARSQATAEGLASDTGNDSTDILFIALAHGGVAAGMDVYLRYCDLTGSENSTFYVARLSTQKHLDLEPRLSQTEVRYLQGLSGGRRVIIFDEDSCSGNTLRIAHRYFADWFKPQKVRVVANLEMKQSDGKMSKNVILGGFGFPVPVDKIIPSPAYAPLAKPDSDIITKLSQFCFTGSSEIIPKTNALKEIAKQINPNLQILHR